MFIDSQNISFSQSCTNLPISDEALAVAWPDLNAMHTDDSVWGSERSSHSTASCRALAGKSCRAPSLLHTTTGSKSTTSAEAAAATATRSSAKCHCFCCVGCRRCAKGELVLELREKFELKMKLESRGQSVPRFADGAYRRITPPSAPAKTKWAVVRAELSEIVKEPDVTLNSDLTLRISLESFQACYPRHGSLNRTDVLNPDTLCSD